ncbi:SPOC like C-terminal domain-containing protein [Haematococcus lacustris]
MANKREFIAFLVDVGESMHSHLPAVSQFLFRTMEAKLLHKPSHEIAVVLYGSDVTRNEPHDEAAARGDQEQNMNVQVLRGLCVPDLEGMKALRQLEPGHGQVDILDGLTVVLDLFVKADQARCLGRSVVKRCVLISNLKAQSSDFDVEYAGALVDKFQDHGVGLEVLVLDFPHDTPLPSASTTAAADVAPTPGAGAAAGAGGGVPAGQGGSEEEARYAANLSQLEQMLAELGCQAPKHLGCREELVGRVRWKEVGHVALFKGWLRLGSSVRMMVKMSKKVGQEKLPALESFMQASDNAQVGLERHTELRVREREEQVVQPGNTIAGYRYGPDLIPVHDPRSLVYLEREAGLQLLGFVDRQQVPRWSWLGESSVVVADPVCPASGPAVSCLVRAMAQMQRLAVARLVARHNSSPRLLALCPWPSPSTLYPDCWVAVALPFRQDLHAVALGPLARAEQITTEEQAAAMRDWVLAMDLGPQDPLAAGHVTGAKRRHEQLRPEDTPNPLLPRFYTLVAERALRVAELSAAGAAAPAYEEELAAVTPADKDELVQAVLEPRPQPFMSSKAARLRELFPTHDLTQSTVAAAAEQHVAAGSRGSLEPRRMVEDEPLATRLSRQRNVDNSSL